MHKVKAPSGLSQDIRYAIPQQVYSAIVDGVRRCRAMQSRIDRYR